MTICTPDQQGDVSTLLKQAGLKVPFEKVNLNSPVVAKVVGEVAELVPYVAPAQQTRNPAKKKPAGESSNARGGRGGARNARGGKPAGEAQGRGGDRRRSDRSGASNHSERPARESRGANAERPSRSARGANGERPSNSSPSARSGGRNAAGAAGGRSRGPRRASSPATGGR